MGMFSWIDVTDKENAKVEIYEAIAKERENAFEEDNIERE